MTLMGMHVKKSHAKLWFLMIAIVIVGLAVAGWFVFGQKTKLPEIVPAKVEVKKAPEPVSIRSQVGIFGNAFWGRYTNDWAMASPLKYAYPFSGLHTLHREQYQAWIAGLECPTRSGVNMTSAQMEEHLQFNCSPEYLPEAAKWFTAFTLANNHTDNQGEAGFVETRHLLDKHGIQYFGTYEPRLLEQICEVIALPVVVTQSDKKEKAGNVPVALCGYHGVFRIPGDDAIELMQRYAKVMPVFAFPHMGQEYKPASDELKTTLYRKMIDNGADAVLGDHPHWIQNAESYKGHLIMYSMGNFMFDQQDTAEVVRSAGVKIKLETGKLDPVLLAKWLKIGESCKEFQDDCLRKAEQQGLEKLPLTYEFSIVGTNDSKKLTHAATPAEAADIERRLKWETVKGQLRTPYSGL